MAEMPLQHDAEGLAGARAPRRHLDRRGHQFTHRRGSRIHMAERHFSQHIALGENPCDSILAVDHRDGRFQPHRGNLPVTKLKHTHKYLLRSDRPEPNSTQTGLTHYDPGETLVKGIYKKSSLPDRNSLTLPGRPAHPS